MELFSIRIQRTFQLVSTVSTTQIYLASIDSSVIDNANELVVSEL